MAFLLSPLARYAIMGVAILAAITGLYFYAHNAGYIAGVESRMTLEQEALKKATEQAMIQQAKADKVSRDADVAAAQSQIQIQTVTKTLIKKVPVYVTAETDRKYPLPLAFCILHDSGAGGAAEATLPDAPSQPNDAPCEVTASQAISIIIANYGRFYVEADKLTKLQAWILSEQKLWNE